jgi:hypothetical protein
MITHLAIVPRIHPTYNRIKRGEENSNPHSKREVEKMSLGQFDEMYEIILSLMEEEEMVSNIKPPEFEAPVEIEHYWWEEAVTEIKMEKEKEELYV